MKEKLDKVMLNKIAMVAAGLVIVIVMMVTSFSIGRKKGRDETVQMISNLAEKYEFYIKDEDGWTLGAAKGGLSFDDFKTSISYEYNADDGKVNLALNK